MTTINATATITVDPASGIIPDVVERWLLNEISSGSAAVTRAGSMPTSQAINPGRIDLTDITKVPSVSIPGGTAANFTGGYLVNVASNSAGRINNPIFAGSSSWSIFMRCRWTAVPSSTGCLAHRDIGNSWSLWIVPGGNIQLNSLKFRTTSPLNVTKNTLSVQANREYSIIAGYDGAADRQFVHVIDDTGHLTPTYSASGIGRRNLFSPGGILIGGGDRGQPMGGAMRDVWFCKSALTEAQCQFIHNGGVPLTFSQSLLMTRNSGPAPFSSIQLIQANFENTGSPGILDRGGCPEGIYYYRPFPLFQWSAALAAAHGNYVWVHSSDHSVTGTSAVSGVWIGFSSSPAVRPGSWTHVISGSSAAGPVPFDQLETPHLTYVPSDPNGRPFYCTAHGDDTSGFSTGLSASQQTRLWTSADLFNWTFDDICIPTFVDGSAIAKDHTGYATAFAPGSLPGQSDWRAYHLGNSEMKVSYCTPSATGKIYQTDDDAAELDSCGPFPAGFDNVNWCANVFSPDGFKAYGLGGCFMPNGARGAALAELAFENGAWRIPTGKIWPVLSDDDMFPSVGYTQDIRAYFESGVLHIYRQRGFYPQSGDERIDYWRMQF